MGAGARVGGGAAIGVFGAWALVVAPRLLSGDTYELLDPAVVMGVGGAALGAAVGLLVHALSPGRVAARSSWMVFLLCGALAGAGMGAFAALTGMTEPGRGLGVVALTGALLGGLAGAALAAIPHLAGAPTDRKDRGRSTDV